MVALKSGQRAAALDMPRRILDIAQELVQKRGFNAFSYADIAAQLNVTKASLHYHFPSKADLGARLIERYHTEFLSALETIEKTAANEIECLERYIKIYESVLSEGRMCLCGMMAADFETLPSRMQGALQNFFSANETWLTRILSSGRDRKHLSFSDMPGDLAHALTGALEGAMLLARSDGRSERFAVTTRLILDRLKS